MFPKPGEMLVAMAYYLISKGQQGVKVARTLARRHRATHRKGTDTRTRPSVASEL